MPTKLSESFHALRPWLVIFLGAIAAHGLMLLNDGLYWDDWLLYTDLINQRWENIWQTFSEAGSPMMAYVEWSMHHFGNIIFAYRFIAFTSILCSAILIYQICLVAGWFTRLEAVAIAVISLTYPAMQVSFELINTFSVVSYFLFLVGVYVALRFARAEGPWPYVLRALSLVCLFLSYGVNSLLVYHFGFLLLLFTTREDFLSLTAIRKFLARHIDFVLLPFLYWGLKQYLFPKHGLFAAYNNFDLTPRSLIYCSVNFLKYGIAGQFIDSARALFRHPIISIVFLLFILLTHRYFISDLAKFAGGRAKSFAMLAFGILLLGLGSFPYVAVGLWPALHGWDTRHALLISLPVGLILVAIYRLVAAARNQLVARLALSLLMTLIVGFTLALIDDYIAWQARWVKDRSVMLSVQQLDGAQSNSVFWIEDQFPKGQQDFYRFYEWSSMFKTVWGEESHVGLDPAQYKPDFLTINKKFFTSRYNLSTVDPEGCQAKLTIHPGPLASSDADLVSHYLVDKFIHPDRLDGFLRGVTHLQLQPVASPAATHCARQQ